MTETREHAALAPLASIRRERAGATAAPRPVSKRPASSSLMSVRTAFVLGRERLEPRLDRARRFPASIAADSSRVLADIARRDLRAVLELAEQPGAERRAANSLASVLPCSDVGGQHEPDRRHHDHREDDQDDEEDGESVAKAHSGTRRPASLVAPRLQSADCGSCVNNDRPDPGL